MPSNKHCECSVDWSYQKHSEYGHSQLLDAWDSVTQDSSEETGTMCRDGDIERTCADGALWMHVDNHAHTHWGDYQCTIQVLGGPEIEGKGRFYNPQRRRHKNEAGKDFKMLALIEVYTEVTSGMPTITRNRKRQGFSPGTSRGLILVQ